MSNYLILNILRQLRELQEGPLWFDQCLRDKISGVSAEEAFERPIPKVHSIAEHVSHIIEWRKECLRRLNMERTDLMNSPDDWKSNEVLQLIGWEPLKRLLYQSTDDLIRALEDKDDAYLDTRFQDAEYNFHYIIEGILQHDIYHLGQMGITIKLLKEK